jgi:DNA-binding NtrC family response regulator
MARSQHFAGGGTAAAPVLHDAAGDVVRRSCVLVAEDEDQVRDLTIALLLANGFDAIAARHGGEALTLFNQHSDRIDAVLLDLSMPVMDGAMVLGELQRQNPSVRVVLTSGYDDIESGVDTERSKSVSFLQKPYRAEKLIAQLRAIIDGHDN